MSGVEVRLLRSEEAPLYVALRREMLAESPWSFGADPDRDPGLDEAGVRRSLAERWGYAMAGAVEGGRLASVGVLIRSSGAKAGHNAAIVSVYTTPARRGAGLSTRVMGLMIETARAWEGVSHLRLSVSERAPEARRLYERLGFAAWGTEPGALRVGGELLDEVYMSLEL